MINSKKKKESDGNAVKSVLASVLCIIIGFLIGGILLLLIALWLDDITFYSAWEGFRIMIAGVFNFGRDFAAGSGITFGLNTKLIGDMLFRATPLIMTGLSVSFAYKTGLFNIGTPGQYLMGTATAIMVGLSIDTAVVPGWLVWITAFIAASLAGAVWGMIPGLLKAFLNVNEVISCIMTNWIAANMVAMVFNGSPFINFQDTGKLGYTLKLNTNGVSSGTLGLERLFPGSNVNIGIIAAVLLGIVCYMIMYKSVFGFELQACGSNKAAAKFAGMSEKRNIVLSMMIAGALAAMGGALYYLSGDVEFYWQTSMSLPAVGFNGIPVALLASCNPIGNIFSGLFMSYLTISGSQLSGLTAYNEHIASIIIAVIVYFSAFTMFFQKIISNISQKKKINPAAKQEDTGRKGAAEQ